MAELIASATAAATSADFTVAAGSFSTVFIKSAASSVPKDAGATIEIKSAGGTYHYVGELSGDSPKTASVVITGPGTYRVSKYSAATAFGIDQV